MESINQMTQEEINRINEMVCCGNCGATAVILKWDNLNQRMLCPDCKFVEKVMDLLPHGSGINGDWGFDWKRNGSLHLHNGYHCMNENGYYDGWVDFTVILHPNDKEYFRLQFNSNRYKAEKYMLREYLTDTIYDALEKL